MRCCICDTEIEPIVMKGKVVWEEGNNADPVAKGGRCCDFCNASVVTPARCGDRVLVASVRAEIAEWGRDEP